MARHRLISSFSAALQGLRHVFRTEHNFRIHTIAAVLIICLALFLPLERWERVALVSAVAAVLTVELINTAIEYIMDLLKPRFNHYVAWVKDVMAAATLVVVLAAILCGIIVLWPYFMILVK